MGIKEILAGTCKSDITAPENSSEKKITRVVQHMAARFKDASWTCHVEPVPIPSSEQVVDLIELARQILFPGYFSRMSLNHQILEYHLGQKISQLHANLAQQVAAAIRHDCFRMDQACTHCSQRSLEIADAFIGALPAIREQLESDIEATMIGDPAASNRDEVIFSYPGLLATTVYRLAHLLVQQQVPIIPRIMSEYAYRRTTIDINPHAIIGSSFFIDHGAGVVIGATTEIGQRVRIYQGVTLGALSLPRDAGNRLRHTKRHPTIEDEVILYANATILGGETVIGARSIIGGNVWLTESVGPDTKVILKAPELIYLGNKRSTP